MVCVCVCVCVCVHDFSVALMLINLAASEPELCPPSLLYHAGVISAFQKQLSRGPTSYMYA